MHVACLDLEGVLVPEVWIGVARRTGLSELLATTRDIPVYDKLMKQRLRILEEQRLGIDALREVVATLAPLDGAREFLAWLRGRFQVFIVSDTFYEIAMPLMEKLGYPTLLCNRLDVDGDGRITGYRMRQSDQKREVVRSLHALNYRVAAAGDSYNDVTMLSEADAGIFFSPPPSVCEAFPQFTVTSTYSQLQTAFEAARIRFENQAPQ